MELLAKNYSSSKRAETRNYKRFNVRMAHWLMKYTNKESTFHNMNHVPNTHVVGTRFT